MKLVALSLVCLLASISYALPNESIDQGFVKLFNGQNWDGWDLKIKSGDAELAKKLYAIEDGMVHIFNDEFPDKYELGKKNATHGLFYTQKKYSKYIFRFEFKWGSKIANNFNRWQYDAGCYYHVYDDSIWPKGIEYQVRYDHTKDRNHTGDFITARSSVKWYADPATNSFLLPKDGGTDMGQQYHKILDCLPNAQHNALNGKWNQCEIIVMGDAYTIHKLNGQIVNLGTELSHSEGIIGLQSETCEIWYRNIEIKEFDEVVPIETFVEGFYPDLTTYQWNMMETTGKPVARHEAAFVECKGKFYLMGGRRIQEVSIFDPAIQTWTSGAKPPIELHHFQGFAYQGKIVVVGVQTGRYPKEPSVDKAYVYDPDTDSWSEGFNMPEGSRARIYDSQCVPGQALYRRRHHPGPLEWARKVL
ncbi:family 16 glycoside hydrolase [Planctomycetota bacterium]